MGSFSSILIKGGDLKVLFADCSERGEDQINDNSFSEHETKGQVVGHKN